uniref:Voltagegated Ion Channel (VIC) Superfamily putative n=1 Tax=Albugo laibachii Nc14 TaxID=890382 RepID=F0W9Q1_9STRA|nr:Voltagegated Ion Channel (VIC) Superfamily putative [Albugo laibachii Nc14]|eukprot:CCA17869.1 Voltagegated Ion Channel (VIC) Superfamily putative [Albugo laibachii Nc14]
MDFSKIFTITELEDESNSKFLGMSFRLQQWHKPQKDADTLMSHAGFPVQEEMEEDQSLAQFWNTLLSNKSTKQKSETAIFKSPLYMSGRLLHPEFCENMLAQVSFFIAHGYVAHTLPSRRSTVQPSIR